MTLTTWFGKWRTLPDGEWSDIHWFRPTGYPDDTWSEPACGAEEPDSEEMEHYIPPEPILTCPRCIELNLLPSPVQDRADG